MDIKRLSPDYAVSPQIGPEDVAAIKAAGFCTVICNRPDPEIPPDLHAEILRGAVEAAGLAFVENPVVGGMLSFDNLSAQENAMAAVDGPVLAYCASGNRSAIVWSLIKAQSGEMSPDEILGATRNAGYDHAGMRGQLEAMAKSVKDA
ncbi:MAG: TIGR01244 family sulfur transferase [Rhodobacteraceae bacterium]|nr:TIGR01244 family sulfur transferase [Paracoccaceae bacterium]